jgi:protein TonB
MFEALHRTRTWQHARLLGAATMAAVLVACASKPPTAPQPPAPPAPRPEPAPLPTPEPTPHRISSASNVQDYRKDAAEHLYALHRENLYVGRMPPLLYAVGVLQTEIDKRGNVTGVRWMRAPSHAPEVMTQIETMVRAAAPYPAPTKIGSVTYTETWLWHKSGRWQLHTLTEGQN